MRSMWTPDNRAARAPVVAPLRCVTLIVRLIEAESRMVVARSSREGHYVSFMQHK